MIQIIFPLYNITGLLFGKGVCNYTTFLLIQYFLVTYFKFVSHNAISLLLLKYRFLLYEALPRLEQ